MANFPTLSRKSDYDQEEAIEDDAVIRSKMEAGYMVSRPRYTRSRKNFGTVKYDNLTDTDKDTLMYFEKSTLSNGALSFDWQNPAEAYSGRKWAASTVYTLGAIVRPITANGRSYKCTVAGTSGGSQPSWPVTKNGTVADNSVTWTENTYTVFLDAPIKFSDKSFGYWKADLKIIEV